MTAFKDKTMRELIGDVDARVDRGADRKPAAWMFELARAVERFEHRHTYTDFGPPQLSFDKPCVPEGSIRNLIPLYKD